MLTLHHPKGFQVLKLFLPFFQQQEAMKLQQVVSVQMQQV
jgi:hypothetical protein